MTRRSRFLTWGLPVIGVGALFAGAYTVAIDRPVRAEEVPPRQPTTAPLTAQGADPSPTFIGAIGVAEPPGEAVAIAAHTAGIVEAVFVRVGDEVREGDPLFRVDTRRQEREVRLRETQLAMADADVAALQGQIPSVQAELEAARAAVRSAEAAVRTAEANLADRRNLLRVAESVRDPRAIAAEEVDNRRFAVAEAEGRLEEARARVTEAEAAVLGARARLELLVQPETGEAGPDVRAALERRSRAAAELALASTELELLTVRSTLAARVIQLNVRPGEFAPARELSEGLVVLARPGRTHIRAQIDEVDIPRFNPSARAWASPRGDAERRIPVKVAYVEPLVVPKRNLSGRTSELVDTRVLEVVFEVIDAEGDDLIFGQQIDLYIEAGATAGAGRTGVAGSDGGGA